MNSEKSPVHQSDEDRQRAWDADRRTEAAPLPGAGLRNYGGNEVLRQVDLAAAERANVARAAGELGLTSSEYRAKRAGPGRSPDSRDV